MSKAVDDLIAAVTKEPSVITGAVTLIQAFAAQVLEAKDDPVRIEQVVAQIDHNAKALAEAVQANTPTTNVAQPGDPGPTPANPPSGNPPTGDDQL